MPPRRLNLKLLTIVGVCLAFAGVAAGATWFLTRSNVRATIAEAEAAEQAGDRELAIELYGKAIKHPRFSRDSDLVMRIANLHGNMPVDTTRLAQYHLKYWLAWLRQAFLVNPSAEDAFQQEMDILIRLGLEVRRAASWDEMFKRTDEVIDQYPHMARALKYRGISQVNRLMMAVSNLTYEERQQALNDLKLALRENRDDQEIILHLARWNVVEARQQERARGDKTRVARLREDAVQMTADAVEIKPDDVQRRVNHVSVLLSLGRHEEMTPHVDALYHQLVNRPATPLITTNVVQLLLRHDLAATLNRRGCCHGAPMWCPWWHGTGTSLLCPCLV